MKVIFLDIDGVMNSKKYIFDEKNDYAHNLIDRSRMPLLKMIADSTNAKIVLSTTWRMNWNENNIQTDYDGKYLDALFSEFGLSIYSKTPMLGFKERNREIKLWLRMHRKETIDGYVILDDVDCFSYDRELCKHFVMTDEDRDGLDEQAVKRAIDILSGNI